MTTPYTAEVGRKFHADGSPCPFAGTTVISFIDVAMPIARMGAWLQEEIRQQPFADKFSMLPPSSFHMTVIQLLNDQDRTPQRWTPHLALTTPMDKICSFMRRRVAMVVPPATIAMRFTGIKRLGNLAFQLEPADDGVATTLCGYRNAVAEATGVCLPDHEHYQFHISLAYRLMLLTAGEQQQLDALCNRADSFVQQAAPCIMLSSPQCTFFTDMCHFVPIDR